MRGLRAIHPSEERGDHPIDRVSRHQRRHILEGEARRRKSGDWGEWEMLPLPSGLPDASPGGWTAQPMVAWRCKVWTVFARPVSIARLDRVVTHLAIGSISGIRPTWPEAQRIKDEIAGTARTAVEVYPPKAEVVDDANMYHLWVLPGALPFGLYDPAEIW